MANTPKMVDYFSPTAGEVIQIPEADAQQMREAGYAVGKDEAATAYTASGPGGTIAAGLLAVARGASFHTSDMWIPDDLKPYAAEVEKQNEGVSHVSEALGGTLPFIAASAATGGLGGGALEAAAARVSVGGLGAAMETAVESSKTDSPLTAERLAQSVGYAVLMSAFAEVGAHAISKAVPAFQRGVNSALDAAADSKYYGVKADPEWSAPNNSNVGINSEDIFGPKKPPPVAPAPVSAPEVAAESDTYPRAPLTPDLKARLRAREKYFNATTAQKMGAEAVYDEAGGVVQRARAPMEVPPDLTADEQSAYDAHLAWREQEDALAKSKQAVPPLGPTAAPSSEPPPLPKRSAEDARLEDIRLMQKHGIYPGEKITPVPLARAFPDQFDLKYEKTGQRPLAGARSVLKTVGQVAGGGGFLYNIGERNPFGTLASTTGYAANAANKILGGADSMVVAALNNRRSINTFIEGVAAPAVKLTTAVVRNAIESRQPQAATEHIFGANDPDAVYEAAATAIPKIVSNPTAVDDFFQRKYGPVLSNQPNLYANLIGNASVAMNYVASQLPKDPRPPSVIPTPYSPPRSEKIEFLHKLQAVNDPFGALQNPTVPGVSAVQAVYPQTLDYVRTQLLTQLTNRKTPLTSGQAKRLSVLFQKPVDGSVAPDYIGKLQLAASGQEAAAQQQQASSSKPGPKPKNMTIGKSAANMLAPGSQQNDVENAQ